MKYLILVLTFFTIVLLVIGVYYLIYGSRIATLKRLEIANSFMEAAEVSETKKERKEQGFSLFKVMGSAVTQKSYFDKIRIKLLQAYIKMKPEEFVGMSFMSAIIVGLLMFLIGRNILAGILGGLIGYKIPDIYIGSIKKKRGRLLNNQLPQALTLISNGLRAGFSFPQSLNVAGKEMDSPIADEFLKVLRDNSLGKPMEEALENLSERTDDEDLDMFVTALLIQRQVGGNLAEVLDTISNTIRERVKLRGEIRSLTAQGRLSAIIISLLPIVLGLVISVLNPGYLDVLFTTLPGIVALVVASIMEIAGIFMLVKLVNIEI
ncbi:type II secretion system F family protein [Youngiibacter multivorans]|uniref:Tight adherence protein B n=1 Tax=Youngiibacter multivorans TaxID=937251 RepID=A0ABS4G8A5_9CLOT|nr:type II secretion system F family protein [Youngiibacter multivorans]MBP1920800.1 tight adherence protein B [Youngiibacter multivorans]